MENEIQAEPVAVETTAPVEASTESGSTDKIRATMEASYDRASDRMPSEAELTRYSNPELPIADETTEQPEVTDNGDTPDYPPQSWKARCIPFGFSFRPKPKPTWRNENSKCNVGSRNTQSWQPMPPR